MIVPSDHIATTLVSRLGVSPEKITVAPPGFARPEARHGGVTPPLILSVGLLARRKGHDVLLDALARLGDLNWGGVFALPERSGRMTCKTSIAAPVSLLLPRATKAMAWF